MSQIRRDDRRSGLYTGSSEVTCDLAPVRPSDVTSRPVVRCSGHIDRSSERFCDKSAGVIKLTAIKVLFLATSAITRIRLIWHIWRQIFQCRI